MLAKSIERWNDALRETSREEGRQEGRQEGEARIVLRQLSLKFGPLAPEVEDRVRSADPDRLLEWCELVLTAESLQAVFGEDEALWSAGTQIWRDEPWASLAQKRPVTLTLEEIATMLAENIDRWNDALREEGRQEGRLEGREKGRQEGEALMMLTVLRPKFGPLAPEVEDRVRSADPDRLLEWGGRVLTAESLQAVFGDDEVH